MLIPFLTFLIAVVLALALVPVLSRMAGPWGLVDLPDDNRKLHRAAIPLVGGIAVFLATAASIILGIQAAGWLPPEVGGQLWIGEPSEILGLVLGSLFLLLVGVVDDSAGIRGRQKLLGQILAVTILVSFGYRFEGLSIWGFQIEFGIFSVLVVYAWMLAAINSINLLDGADGFASTIGIILSLTLGAMSIYQGRYFDASLAFAMAGSLVGFLRYNFPPAKAFLGDAGSMLIGFVLAALAIRCTFKEATAYAFFAPVALLAIPFIDTAAAIVRRRLTGRSIYSVDRGHIHHVMARRGFSPVVSLLWVAALCSTTAAGAFLSIVTRESEYAIASIAMVIVVMFLTRIFGVAELQLVFKRVAGAIQGLLFPRTRRQHIQQSTVQLQGNRNWELVWDQLSDFADEHELNEITFDLNMPWIHESFHATRKKAGVRHEENRVWFAEIPVIAGGRIMGRIELTADKDGRFSYQDIITNLLKLTADVEMNLLSTAAESRDQATVADQKPSPSPSLPDAIGGARAGA